MGKSHPIELRIRVMAYVDEGHSHRKAARHFRVSPRFVNDLAELRRETGELTARRQGNGGGHRKLSGVTGWLKARAATKGKVTLDELVAELAEIYKIDVSRVTVWRMLRELELTGKGKAASVNEGTTM